MYVYVYFYVWNEKIRFQRCSFLLVKTRQNDVIGLSNTMLLNWGLDLKL